MKSLSVYRRRRLHLVSLMLEESSIKVAQYYTQLPDKKILSEKLHKGIAIAQKNHKKTDD